MFPGAVQRKASNQRLKKVERRNIYENDAQYILISSWYNGIRSEERPLCVKGAINVHVHTYKLENTLTFRMLLRLDIYRVK